jgi:hypothetical protein
MNTPFKGLDLGDDDDEIETAAVETAVVESIMANIDAAADVLVVEGHEVDSGDNVGWTSVMSKKKKSEIVGDILLVCSMCKLRFTFSAKNQEKFNKLKYNIPRRCKKCNLSRKTNSSITNSQDISVSETIENIVIEDGKKVVVQTI